MLSFGRRISFFLLPNGSFSLLRRDVGFLFPSFGVIVWAERVFPGWWGGGGGGGIRVFRSPSQRYKDTRSWVSFQHALGLTSTRTPGISPFLCLLRGTCTLLFAMAAKYFVRPISVIRIPVRGYPFSMHLGLLVLVRLLLEGLCQG